MSIKSWGVRLFITLDKSFALSFVQTTLFRLALSRFKPSLWPYIRPYIRRPLRDSCLLPVACVALRIAIGERIARRGSAACPSSEKKDWFFLI